MPPPGRSVYSYLVGRPYVAGLCRQLMMDDYGVLSPCHRKVVWVADVGHFERNELQCAEHKLEPGRPVDMALPMPSECPECGGTALVDITGMGGYRPSRIPGCFWDGVEVQCREGWVAPRKKRASR